MRRPQEGDAPSRARRRKEQEWHERIAEAYLLPYTARLSKGNSCKVMPWRRSVATPAGDQGPGDLGEACMPWRGFGEEIVDHPLPSSDTDRARRSLDMSAETGSVSFVRQRSRFPFLGYFTRWRRHSALGREQERARERTHSPKISQPQRRRRRFDRSQQPDAPLFHSPLHLRERIHKRASPQQKPRTDSSPSFALAPVAAAPTFLPYPSHIKKEETASRPLWGRKVLFTRAPM